MVTTAMRPLLSTAVACHQLQTSHALGTIPVTRRLIGQKVRQAASSSKGKYPPFVAIVGSGPAGFYAARRLITLVDNVRIDMYEQLPTPFGLVRYGVAPDHPEVKNCQDTFAEVARSNRFRFIGNVNVGRDVSLKSLSQHYDALLFAYGASRDRALDVHQAGTDIGKHVYSARAFVGWYNGLPEYRHLDPDLSAGESAIIIGQGNVAMDVARILLTEVETLRKTDITPWALERLGTSRIKHVDVVGRRGPLQAAFTIKEVRELMQLHDTHFTPIPRDLFPQDLSALPRPQKRLLQLLQKGSANPASSTRSWSLRFLLSPHSLIWSDSFPGKLMAAKFTRNVLTDPQSPASPVMADPQSPVPVEIPTSTLFSSIGYKSEPLPGFEELGIKFDHQKGIIANDGLGRVVSTDVSENPEPSLLYCTGWVKRGPTGVIASTMGDAFATAEAIATDLLNSREEHMGSPKCGWEGVMEAAKAQETDLHPVFWDDWERIDSAERKAGEQNGRIREKFGTVQRMLEATTDSA